MTTISLSRDQIISTVDFIVERYENAQAGRWIEIRSVISPSVGEYCHWRDCFLGDWERARSELQGILLLLGFLSDSDDLIKYLKCSKEKVTDLWTQCGVDLTSLQHPEYKASADIQVNERTEQTALAPAFIDMADGNVTRRIDSIVESACTEINRMQIHGILNIEWLRDYLEIYREELIKNLTDINPSGYEQIIDTAIARIFALYYKEAA
jgi:hypothetical protein